jgi:hypothetical protein
MTTLRGRRGCRRRLRRRRTSALDLRTLARSCETADLAFARASTDVRAVLTSSHNFSSCGFVALWPSNLVHLPAALCTAKLNVHVLRGCNLKARVH